MTTIIETNINNIVRRKIVVVAASGYISVIPSKTFQSRSGKEIFGMGIMGEVRKDSGNVFGGDVFG